MQLRAVFRDGVFVPEKPVDLADETGVSLTVHVTLIPPTITDPEEWQRRMDELLDRMQQNPIPAGAPKFTRDELHERR